MDTITIEEFRQSDIKIGKVISAEKVEGADKLLRLEVDFGEFKRQIVAGIVQFYKPEELIGKKFPFVVNLEPKTFRGVESQGMLMAIDGPEGKPIFLEPSIDVPEGAVIV